MISDTDLPHQPDDIQQPPLMKKKCPPWKAFFIPLLAVHLIVGLWAANLIGRYMWQLTFGIVVLPLIFVLAIIDFIAVFISIKKHHP
jgi:hypothetical protein